MSILGILLFGFPNLKITWPEWSQVEEKSLRVVVMSDEEIKKLEQEKFTPPAQKAKDIQIGESSAPLPGHRRSLQSSEKVRKEKERKEEGKVERKEGKKIKKAGEKIIGVISPQKTNVNQDTKKYAKTKAPSGPEKKTDSLSAFRGISTVKEIPSPTQDGDKEKIQTPDLPATAKKETRPSPDTLSAKPPSDEISKIAADLADKIPRLRSLRDGMKKAGQKNKKNPALKQTLKRMQARAEEGYAHAQFSLAEMMLTGEAPDGSIKKAMRLLNRAAIGGYLPAQLALGMLSAEGSGIKRNVAEAHTWWAVATEQGNTQAREALHRLEKRMDSRQTLEARKRSYQLRKVLVIIHGTDLKKASKAELSDRLRVAAALGDIESVHILLAQGADADGADEDGRNAAIEAAWRGYVGIIKTLIEDGANLAAADKTGKNPLMWASINGHAGVAEQLIDAGAPIDTQDSEGITALMRAAWNGHVNAVKILLKKGADFTLKDKKGRSALDFSILEGNKDILKILEKARAGK